MFKYADSCAVESESVGFLTQFIVSIFGASNAILIPSHGERWRPMMQKIAGDLLIETIDGTESIEFKIEAENRYGNLFIETWSNRALETRGWIVTSYADTLAYYFQRSDELYIMDMDELQTWFRPRWRQWACKRQSKYDQLNDTWGCLVPIAEIAKSITSFQFYQPKKYF